MQRNSSFWRACRQSHLATCLLAAVTLLGLAGCGVSSYSAPAGAVAGRAGQYDYSPSAIQTGNLQQIWWCGVGQDPENSDLLSDVIFYGTVDTVTGVSSPPAGVLGESPDTWDKAYTCNPRVIRGRFTNPLGDGKTYTYEMFYTATALVSGVDNSIGAAFSNDGVSWKKYPDPVILSTSTTGYGVGQAVAYNADGKSAITLTYEDNTPTLHHVQATSSDGVHFTVKGTITMNGIDPGILTWGDMEYDPKTHSWFALFNTPSRVVCLPDCNVERGQYGVQLYSIPDSGLLDGSSSWKLLTTVDTNSTGFEANFIPSLLNDGLGNINFGTYPNLKIFMSTSNYRIPWDSSAAIDFSYGNSTTWDITQSTYTPGAMLTLNRYVNGSTYKTTTGWIDPNGGFTVDAMLGHLYQGPQNGATLPLYGCKADTMDYYTSTDSACVGGRILGLQGYGYAQPVSGTSTVAIYSCKSQNKNHFVSKDAACEGNGDGTLLGYILP